MNRVLIGSVEHDGRRDRTLSVYSRFAKGMTHVSAGARLATVGQTFERMYPLEEPGLGRYDPTAARRVLTDHSCHAHDDHGSRDVCSADSLRECRQPYTGARHRTPPRNGHSPSLGAARSRIVRQLLTENILIAVASIPLGIAFAYWGRNLVLGGQATPEMQDEISIDGQVLIYTIAVAI